MIARQFGYNSPFDEELTKDLRHSYRRILLEEALNVKDQNDTLTEEIYKSVKGELLDTASFVNVMNAVGCAIINSMPRFKKTQPIKVIIELKKEEDNIITLPDGAEIEVY